MIYLENIQKYYYDRCVLDIPNFTFESGKKYAILGTNGSGKSTLLRILADSIKADVGKVQKEFNNIGYMPQSPYIFSMSVKKNLELVLLNKSRKSVHLQDLFIRRSQKKEISNKKDISNCLKKVGLEELEDTMGNLLSGGEAQRLAFARIIAMQHDLLLLDEPTSAMDIVGIDLIEQALKEYLKDNKCTLIFTTQNPSQAIHLSDYILLLNKGKIIECGPSGHILTHPQSNYGKSFLSHWRI